MKLVSTYGHNWKRTNVQLVSLACGLALATAAIAGGYEVLRDKENTTIISPVRVAQPIRPVMEEPDFGSVGIDYTLDGLAAHTSATAALQDARGMGQPGEGVKAVEATLIDPTDLGSLGIESALQRQFGTAADAVYAGETLRAAEAVTVVDPHFGTGVESVSAIEGDYLGIGQPNEGVTSVEATLIDPTDFGSMGMAYELAQNRPRASAALPAKGSLEADYSLPTSFPLVQEMSHPMVPAFQPGETEPEPVFYPLVQEMSHPVVPAFQPGEADPEPTFYPLVQEMSHGSGSEPQFGTMADADFASR